MMTTHFVKSGSEAEVYKPHVSIDVLDARRLPLNLFACSALCDVVVQLCWIHPKRYSAIKTKTRKRIWHMLKRERAVFVAVAFPSLHILRKDGKL
jgi:hypothetical protein